MAVPLASSAEPASVIAVDLDGVAAHARVIADRFSFGEASLFEVFERTVWWKSSWLVPLLIASSVAFLYISSHRPRTLAKLCAGTPAGRLPRRL
jgi:hypothetical protein